MSNKVKSNEYSPHTLVGKNRFTTGFHQHRRVKADAVCQLQSSSCVLIVSNEYYLSARFPHNLESAARAIVMILLEVTFFSPLSRDDRLYKYNIDDCITRFY